MASLDKTETNDQNVSGRNDQNLSLKKNSFQSVAIETSGVCGKSTAFFFERPCKETC